MPKQARQTRENRTITIDFQNEATYFQLPGDGKAFLEFVFAFLLDPMICPACKWLRSWRRPLPSAFVRRKSILCQKDQGVQWLRTLFFQYLHKIISNHNKMYHSHNYLIFLLFL
jgi:hypothetical protein